MRFNEEKMRKTIKAYLDEPGIDFDEDIYKMVEDHAYTSNFETIIFIYGLVLGEFARQGIVE